MDPLTWLQSRLRALLLDSGAKPSFADVIDAGTEYVSYLANEAAALRSERQVWLRLWGACGMLPGHLYMPSTAGTWTTWPIVHGSWLHACRPFFRRYH
jgi:hypothetical protein